MDNTRKRNALERAPSVASREFLAREQRIPVSLPASVYISADRTVPVCIVDLSASGLRLSSAERLEPGMTVDVLTRKDADQVVIKWVNGTEAGGVFVGHGRLITH